MVSLRQKIDVVHVDICVLVGRGLHRVKGVNGRDLSCGSKANMALG